MVQLPASAPRQIMPQGLPAVELSSSRLNLRSFGPTDAVEVFSASRSHLRDLPAFVPFVSKIACDEAS